MKPTMVRAGGARTGHCSPHSEPEMMSMFGAEVISTGVRYRVWAPETNAVEVLVRRRDSEAPERTLALQRDEMGFHTVDDPDGAAGDGYQFRLAGGEALADPSSHAQRNSVYGPSVVVDHSAYPWSDTAWQRPRFRDLVIYELHVGTFTEAGTFRAAIDKLPHLHHLGVNAIELMPIADFPGRWNWGYDGVLIYAPARAYGSPDDLRALVDAAHAHGIAVMLDVVYNHLGPDGNCLPRYSASYFNEAHHTPWGKGFNFDGDRSEQVRAFFASNPVYWMEHFHIDGFRLDATHAMADDSATHILAEIAARIHERGGYVIAEDARNEVELLESPEAGGFDLDAVWADDFHHVARVAQTGQREAYFRAYHGTLDELIETLRHGWLYRGQVPPGRKHGRGTECRHLRPSKFVHCISNHDQIGNRAFGERLNHLISPEAYRAASMLLCLTPYTPMLFMGQEWSASTPFLYFTDHHEQLGPLVTEGRRREFADFAEFSDPAAREQIPDPQLEETFRRSKLNWDALHQSSHGEVLALYTECLRLRRVARAFRPDSREGWDVAALSFGVGALRLQGEGHEYLLVFDLVGGHSGSLAAEPIAASPDGSAWELVFFSNERRFGGDATGGFDEARQFIHFPLPGCVVTRLRR